MRKIALCAIVLGVSEALCQTPARDADTLQMLLAEVHQLRQDIEAMTVASQRVQIALYTLQIQDAAVARAAKRLDETRDRCRGQEGGRQHTASEIQRLESALAEAEAAPAGKVSAGELKDGQLRLAEMKSNLEHQSAETGACQSAESEASTALRNEQARLTELQDRIARLDKALEQLGTGAK